eukprot:TRINITY_DN3187_c0_g1_i2.p1 TRINITY_DN3187_c0_g1~~TRINITY_DN3187_c0_g1_i2.p1  ORF type:complete len:212 (+),score=40.55 TRINITY_DN3187_c0_g1_i2:54-689(+)
MQFIFLFIFIFHIVDTNDDYFQLIEPSSIEKISAIDGHIGAAMSGLTADARTLIQHARVVCANHFFNYNEPMRVEACTQAICDLALRFGEGKKKKGGDAGGMARPFGVSLLIAGCDELGPQLWCTDPSGTFLRYKAKAIGAGSDGAQTILQEKYNSSLTLHESQILALSTLKQVMEEKLTSDNVDLAVVRADTKKFELCSKEEIDALIAEL